MHFPPERLIALRTFGYTEAEARFLYLVAAHSGYFTVRQFLEFTQARSGKRNAQLVEKLCRLGHASARRYLRRNLVFQLRSRQIYTAIGKEHLRHRRDHELAHIKTRLLALDFIVAHPEESYFESPEEKRHCSKSLWTRKFLTKIRKERKSEQKQTNANTKGAISILVSKGTLLFWFDTNRPEP